MEEGLRWERGEPRLNVELKATDADPARSLAACRALGARDRGLISQRDTYFGAARGRLKLREEVPGSAHVIAYARADVAGARPSRYRTAPVPAPDALREALAEALGVKAVVEKERRLLLWANVRIHLDRVTGLGSFLELEAVAAPGADPEVERARVEHLCGILAIGPERLVPGSYADALRRAGAGAPARTTIVAP